MNGVLKGWFFHRTLVATLLLVTTLFSHQVCAADDASVKGSLVIAGGALRPETAEVWQRIVALAGGKGAPIAVLGSASDDPKKSAESVIATLKRYGARAYFVPVAMALKNVDDFQAARDLNNVAAINKARGVYFTGGDQGRVTKVLLDAAGQRTPVLDAIWNVYQRGGVIAGSSAGAAIMSSTMFYEPADHLTILRNGIVDGRDVAPGLGFIGKQWFVDQHFLVRGRFARAIPAMLFAGYAYGLGIDENTAAVVTWKKQQRDIEIIGRSGALFLNLKDAIRQTADHQVDAALQVSNVRLSLLGPGDRIDMTTGLITPSPAKLKSRRIAIGAADLQTTVSDRKIDADMLDRSVLVEAMTYLIGSRQTEAVGLAFDANANVAPNIGFEFRFHKAQDSVGYYADGFPLNGYTVLNLRLDITPTEFAVPLYRVRPVR